jgi:hypothetical protein
MIRAAMVALLLLPLGCTVSALPGSESNKLHAGDGGAIDLGPGGGHDDGGGCNGGGVDLAWPADGGFPIDAFPFDAFPFDAFPFDAGPSDGGHHHDGGPIDLGHGGPVDLAH